jgi:pimeloyl-ACP methyl ester carboxylesterase
VHGWPETRRIWQRNIEPLGEAGFEVIAPDLRGFGDSPLASDDRYDVAAHSHDLRALLSDELGHEQITVCAGDLGGVIAQDMSLRFEGLVERLCLFNTIPPRLPAGGSTGRASGPPGHVHPRAHRLHDRALCRRREVSRIDRELRVRRPFPSAWRRLSRTGPGRSWWRGRGIFFSESGSRAQRRAALAVPAVKKRQQPRWLRP